MSINSMTNAAVARLKDFEPAGAPSSLAAIARSASAEPRLLAQLPDGQPQPAASSDTNTVLNVLAGYIPTEVITIYVAIVACFQTNTATRNSLLSELSRGSKQDLQSIGQTLGAIPFSNEMWVFLGCLAATPAVVWLVYAAKVRSQTNKLPTWRQLPVWEMVAGTIAFAGWVCALPSAPLAGWSHWQPAFGAVIAIVTSTILGLLAGVFATPQST